jgi:hypothetical protein
MRFLYFLPPSHAQAREADSKVKLMLVLEVMISMWKVTRILSNLPLTKKVNWGT